MVNNLDWFNIDNYNYLNNASIDEIKNAIKQRYFDFYDLNFFGQKCGIKHNSYMTSKEKLLDKLYSLINNKKTSNKIQVVNTVKIFDVNQYSDLIYDQKSSDYGRFIFDALIKNVDNKIKAVDRDIRDLNRDIDFTSYQITPNQELQTVYNVSSEYKFIPELLSIDLNYSDEKILSDFKKWLEDKKNKKISQNKITKIINYKVIPFIDLFIWEKLTSNYITRPLKIEMLYPYNYGEIDNDHLKKRTEAYFKEIFINKGYQYLI